MQRPGVSNVSSAPPLGRPVGAAGGQPDIMSLLQKAQQQGVAATMAASQQQPQGLVRGGYAAVVGSMGAGTAGTGTPAAAVGGAGMLGGMAAAGGGLPLLQQAQPPPQQATPQPQAQPQQQAPPSIGPDGYGILGLLGVIRTPDRDLNVLALGTDLTTLNLNLNTAEPLHASFAHPWTDTPATKEPALTLPATYRVPQPALKTGHFSKFSVGTLIYIFYSMPRDVLQAYAAQELYNREWRFHRDTKLWFKREPTPAAPATAGGAGPTAASEYVYWDVSVWEKRPYSGPVPALLAGFLSEEEVRIRPAGAAAAPGAAGGVPAGAGGAPTAAGSS